MNKLFYPKLAASNLKKQGRTYVPYIITCICTVAMFYNIFSLSVSKSLANLIGGEMVGSMMALGSIVAAIFCVILLLYASVFLMKKRQKEFGVYNILGMGKAHICKTIFFETFYVAAISIVGGMGVGIVFSKLVSLLVTKMLGANAVFGFEVSAIAVGVTVILFFVIFILSMFNNFRQVAFSNTVELLKGGNVGEKEPKTKWLLAIIGAVFLCVGYGIALMVEEPIAAIFSFFVAVLCVIIGTYCLFTAGSIVLLKALRKNKKYYYKEKHFVSVSSMLYRMKQNAVGLANICILSTAVLVIVGTTVSLYIGKADTLETRYPQEVNVTAVVKSESEIEALNKKVDSVLRNNGVTQVNEVSYTSVAFNLLKVGNGVYDSNAATQAAGGISMYFITADGYKNVTGKDVTLAKNDAMILCQNIGYDEEHLTVLGKEFDVVAVEDVKDIDAFNSDMAANIGSSCMVVINDISTFNEIVELGTKSDGTQKRVRQIKMFDLSEEMDIDALNTIGMQISTDSDFQIRAEARAVNAQGMNAMYGGFLFLGIFLAILFIMATVLIIYYKQVSEGFEDRERFEIMQKVGMDKGKIKKSIASQVMTMFFLPLLMAGLHILVAFPVLTKLLRMFLLTNTTLIALCILGTFLVFSLLYFVVYTLTARAYFKIVS